MTNHRSKGTLGAAPATDGQAINTTTTPSKCNSRANVIDMNKNQLIVYCTCPDRQTAEKIAGTLVTERLAACVSIVSGVTSVYKWEGKLEKSDEIMLMIKTTQAGYAKLEQSIVAEHPYELPEIMAVSVTDGLDPYLRWIDSSIEHNNDN